MPHLALDDFSIYYEDLGSGDPVICIPGALGTGTGDFHEQLPHLSERHRVIAPDPRGYGQSRPPARDYPLNFYRRDARDLLALLTALGIARFSVLGWSDGANVGCLMAALEPSRVDRLIIWGGNSYLSAEEMQRFRAMRSLSSWSARAAEGMRAIYGDELGPLWAAYVDGLDDLFRQGGEVYRSQLSRIQCPTLILHGAHDPLVPAFHPLVLRDGIRDVELYTFAEGKHNIHMKYAAQFNGLVSAFLDATHATTR